MDKPFLSIDQQLSLLESRGVTTSDDTRNILMREGYYSVVNGYKRPFIDQAATEAAGDDRYRSGTSFSDLYALFVFDRELRSLTFRYLILAEATVRTAVAYSFTKAHRGPDDYLLQQNYCTRDEYSEYGLNPSNYAPELTRLTGLLGRIRSRGREDFLSHYREHHDNVPLWVLANAMTFGNIEHFFNLMQPSDKRSVCRMICAATGHLGDRRLGFFGIDKARVGLEALVKYRNICAHDERLYCAGVGGRKDIGYVGMLWFLERYLTDVEFNRLLDSLLELLDRSINEHEAIATILDPLGFPELVDELHRRLSKH